MHLIRAVDPTELLHGFVRRPRQLQADHAPGPRRLASPGGLPAVAVQGDACRCSLCDDGDELFTPLEGTVLQVVHRVHAGNFRAAGAAAGGRPAPPLCRCAAWQRPDLARHRVAGVPRAAAGHLGHGLGAAQAVDEVVDGVRRQLQGIEPGLEALDGVDGPLQWLPDRVFAREVLVQELLHGELGARGKAVGEPSAAALIEVLLRGLRGDGFVRRPQREDDGLPTCQRLGGEANGRRHLGGDDEALEEALLGGPELGTLIFSNVAFVDTQVEDSPHVSPELATRVVRRPGSSIQPHGGELEARALEGQRAAREGPHGLQLHGDQLHGRHAALQDQGPEPVEGLEGRPVEAARAAEGDLAAAAAGGRAALRPLLVILLGGLRRRRTVAPEPKPGHVLHVPNLRSARGRCIEHRATWATSLKLVNETRHLGVLVQVFGLVRLVEADQALPSLGMLGEPSEDLTKAAHLRIRPGLLRLVPCGNKHGVSQEQHAVAHLPQLADFRVALQVVDRPVAVHFRQGHAGDVGTEVRQVSDGIAVQIRSRGDPDVPTRATVPLVQDKCRNAAALTTTCTVAK
mmetsp:Transcript_128975/g.413090  ORF Transcript_128975/g.413090 Transcript_128975/m.413090 type:complete len:573 (-) Transcript_128975:811-2529(-)